MTGQSFTERLKNNPGPVVVDIWAPWCGPCRAIEPALKTLAQQYQGRVDVWKINADEQPEMVKTLGVRGIPTLLVFRGETEVTRQVGASSQAALERLFEAALSGEVPERTGLTNFDRALRMAGGLILVAFGIITNFSLLFFLAAGLVFFSAFHDRCPIWQALRPRLEKLWRA